ncbi:hypothetical protein CP533_4232 [Ophiocordyceps camponoti-saundersi (nom. inval.)]|nr:hypothetical protein CP533_4232 [Ophiocordyceps camponoti-saundersi (nom. inval.)]
MKTQVILALIATHAGLSIGAPHTGEATFNNMSLVKREEMAASCLKMLCCPNKKRDLDALQSNAQAQCLVCWKFGVCDKAVRENIPDKIGKVSTEIDSNIIHNNQNFQNGGFWVKRGGREYWVDNSGQYWEWMGTDGKNDLKNQNNFRLGGHGRVERGNGGKWYYTFLD